MNSAVQKYIGAVDDQTRKENIETLVTVLSQITGEPAAMWGTSIISFGMYHYKYASGREGDAPKIGLSSRKNAIVLYGLHIAEIDHPNSKLLEALGKHKTGKGCLYINRLSDIDIEVLKAMVQNAATE